jgi:hypothetical protein
LYAGQARSFSHHQKWTSDDRQGRKGVEHEAIIMECKSPINPCDSGGPVTDDRGELIALTTGDVSLPNRFIDVQEVRKFLAHYYKTKGTEPPEGLVPARRRP